MRANNFFVLTVFVAVLFVITPLGGSVPGQQVVQLPGLAAPDSITVDSGSGNIYITEFPVISIYSMKDFKLNKKFGRKGEGPGEFLRYTKLHVLPDKLAISDRNKVTYFSKEGVFINEIKAKSLANWGVRPLGNKFAGKSKTKIGKTEFDTAVLYSPDLRKEKEICRYRFFYTEWKGGKKCDAVEVSGLRFQSYGDKLFVKGKELFEIDVFDENGNKLYTIQRDFEKVKITEADKQRYRDYFKTAMPWKRLYEERLKKEIFFRDHFPAIQRFLVADEKIYVMTYRRKENKPEFLVLDLKGKLLKQTFLPMDAGDDWFQYSLYKSVRRGNNTPTFTIHNGKLYQLRENPDTEEWELYIFDI